MIESIDKLIDKYSAMLKNVFIHPVIFIGLVIIVLGAAYLRYTYLMQSCTAKTEKDKKLYKSWANGHVILETAITITVAYIIIKLTGAVLTNILLNWIIAPLAGGVLSIIIDNNIFIKFEHETGGMGPMSLLKKNKPSNDNKSNDKDKDDQINIIINNGSDNKKDNNKNDEETISSKDIKVKKDKPIKAEDLETDAGYAITAEAINRLQERQSIAEAALEKFSEDLIKDEETIKVLRKAIINDKKSKLKRMIYNLLDQGYATPAQNDAVIDNRKEYIELLNGKLDNDIEALYNERYSKLGVHEDRRKKNISVENDRRKPSK